jgi:hypothetical protein
MTDQIEVEFLNNRQKVISEALREIVSPEIKVVVPSYLKEAKAVQAIDKGRAQIKKAVETLKERVTKLLENPARNDPVFKIVRRAFANANSMNLKTCEEKTRTKIFEAALLRFQRGFPPRKKQDSTTGDAINWEWVLHCAKTFKRDVLLVSRDSDFGLFEKGLLNDWLAREFQSNTRMKARLLPSLSQALKSLKVEVTAAEQQEEKKLIQEAAGKSMTIQGGFPPFWPRVLELVELRSPVIFCNLSKATKAAYVSDNLTISFGFNDLNSLREAEEGRCREVLLEIFRDFPFVSVKEITFMNDVDVWSGFELQLQGVMPKNLY